MSVCLQESWGVQGPLLRSSMDSFFKAAVCDLDKLLDDFELNTGKKPTSRHGGCFGPVGVLSVGRREKLKEKTIICHFSRAHVDISEIEKKEILIYEKSVEKLEN